MGFSAFDEVRAFFAHAIVHDTDGTSNIQVLASAPYGVRIDTWLALSIDTVAREFLVQITDAGSIFQVVARFTVPASAGTAGVAPYDVLAAILPPTTQGLVLPASTQIEISALVTLSAAKYTSFSVLGGYF